MRASDIYGKMGVGNEGTQDVTNSTSQTKTDKGTAQAVATNSGALKNSYATIALLGFVGILVGAKFAFERSGGN